MRTQHEVKVNPNFPDSLQQGTLISSLDFYLQLQFVHQSEGGKQLRILVLFLVGAKGFFKNSL